MILLIANIIQHSIKGLVNTNWKGCGTGGHSPIQRNINPSITCSDGEKSQKISQESWSLGRHLNMKPSK
jgi:hypothetical protein